jgi:ABC-2 type transport system ATP-binding protein
VSTASRRTTVLSAQDVSKRLRRRSVLTGVTITVAAGEIVGVAGENGAGKTTLLRILAGVLRPDGGTIERHGSLGYAPQAPLLFEQLTVREHFSYFAAARLLPTTAWQRAAAALLERYRFADWQDYAVAALSEGTKQKLSLALALLPEPQLVLLDEPYGGFEWETYLRFWEHARELSERGHSIVIVSHLFHDRARLDRLLELRDGRLSG